MGKVADLLGLAVANTEAKVAVVRCNGSCEHRPRIAEYDGLQTCAAMNSCGAGETGCGFGCLGCGDCVAACQFGAISINLRRASEVDEEKYGLWCVRQGLSTSHHRASKEGSWGRRVYVQCVNHDKGAVAKKACSVACIGCVSVRKSASLKLSPSKIMWLMSISTSAACTKCVDECPTGALVKVNFPVKKKGGIIMNLRTFRIGGVHPEENKITAEMATRVAPLPKQAIFPLGQHIGAPAKPVVAKATR